MPSKSIIQWILLYYFLQYVMNKSLITWITVLCTCKCKHESEQVVLFCKSRKNWVAGFTVTLDKLAFFRCNSGNFSIGTAMFTAMRSCFSRNSGTVKTGPVLKFTTQMFECKPETKDFLVKKMVWKQHWLDTCTRGCQQFVCVYIFLLLQCTSVYESLMLCIEERKSWTI